MRESLEVVNLKKKIRGGLLSSKECYLNMKYLHSYLIGFTESILYFLSGLYCIAKVLELVSHKGFLITLNFFLSPSLLSDWLKLLLSFVI